MFKIQYSVIGYIGKLNWNMEKKTFKIIKTAKTMNKKGLC